MSLSQIDELISHTEYNTALNELSLYMEQHPQEFDAAQKRVDKIMKNRREYDAHVKQLLNVLETDETSEQKSEKVLEIIGQLESLEKNPTDKNIAFIRQAKSAAQFVVYKARYEAIMADGADLVKSGKYVEGAKRFTEGFVLYRKEFDEDSSADASKKAVYAALSEINTNLPQLQAAINACEQPCAELTEAIKTENLPWAQKVFPKVKKSFSEYASLRNQMAEAGRALKTEFETLQEQDAELTDASFLGFAYRFALGRSSDSSTGVLGAFDTFWNGHLASIKDLLYQTVLRELELAVSVSDERLFLPGEQYAAQKKYIPLAEGFASLSGDTNNLYALLKNADGTMMSDMVQDYQHSLLFAETVSRHISDSYGYIADIAESSDFVREAGERGELESAFSEYIPNLMAMVTRYERIKEDSFLINAQIQEEREREKNDKTLSFEPVLTLYELLNQTVADRAESGAGTMWASLAMRCADEGNRWLADFTARKVEAENLCNGVSEHEFDIPKHYPSRAITICTSLNEAIAKSKIQLSDWRTVLSGGEDYRIKESDYNLGTIELDRIIAALDPLLAESTNLIAQARAQVQLAKRSENEANLRYNEAESSFNKGNFEAARTSLQRARTKYNESLSYNESESLRASSDKNLADLGARIAAGENEIVVREVRVLKNRAKQAYYEGNFEEAENSLVQAKNRWAVTNVEDDQEITNLLALVATALSMKTGRVIPPTAPLYPEMSQILSISNQYYNEGASLMKQGKSNEAAKILTQAKEKLRSLLLVYPFNQEARLLNLRIDQLTDSSSFDTTFSRMIASAKKDYKDASKRQQAYADLLDLYEINPSYAGLKQLIYDVEIEIGVRQKPVDNSAKIKSKSLFENAQKIYAAAGRNESQLRDALSLLDQAIALNADNGDAILLKDRIQIAVGGKASVVLSSADEAMYQQAVQALQKNNIVSANAMVEQLLQKPANRRSAKILNLQERIKALM